MKPVISICLCSYNDAPYLNLLFKSIYNNTYLPYEVCLLDNASTDETREVVDKWKERFGDRMIAVFSPKNAGVQAVNDAVKYSNGKYVLDINSDMVLLPSWDQAMIASLKTLERNGLASVSAKLIEPYAGNPEYFFFDAGKTPEEFDYNKLIEQCVYNIIDDIATRKRKAVDTIQFSHPIMMSRKLWDKVGGITEGWFPSPGMMTDVDLGFKLLEKGAQCCMIDRPICYHFGSATLNRMRKNGIATPPGKREFIEKWGHTPEEMYAKYNVRSKFK